MGDRWKDRAKRLLKSELAKRDISHPELVRLLSRVDVSETVAGVRNKISRGSFSTAFFLKCMHAMGVEEVDLNLPDRDGPESSTTEEWTRNGAQFSLTFSEDEIHDPRLYRDRVRGRKYLDIREKPEVSSSQNEVISLFTGTGGLDIGLEAAGFETAVCVEVDDDCRETFRQNTDWPIFEDDAGGSREPGNVREIKAGELLDFASLKKGEPALVVGGAPCQPFSNIGKKKGTDDPENGDLFLEFVRIVEGTRPKAFIFENVAGITQSRHEEVISYMTEQFEGLGYSISWSKLNAADYGVPQKRIRFFFVGVLGEEKPAFPLPTHFRNRRRWEDFVSNLDRDPGYLPEDWTSVREAFGRIPDDFKERPDYVQMNHTERVRKRMEYVGPGQNFKVVPDEHLPNCWTNGKHQGQDTFGRMEWDSPSNTIRTAAYNPSKGKYIHPEDNRGLNSYEMKVLQGFDPDWELKLAGKDGMTLKSAGNQIGNAVPPPLAEAIGRSLGIHLDATDA
ncbi:DNA cytosine methyltransferase [Salinibacter ruber]|uniref:DNA cytosine methyltransferase n=1 Tax=Salinibacter ruber TaxID=146919 RepID=UPI002072C5E5|nr:DNA (cytosine-5-)-methyltransferase [Salinibacter ruber]